jgi:anti-sigma28 factor (negative regulator of flagellin synthesis)
MRIDPSSPVTLEPRDAASTPSAPTAPASDVVALSPAGAAATAPTDHMTERLARIRALVQQGAYPIDLDMLASRIVNDELLRNKGPA